TPPTAPEHPRSTTAAAVSAGPASSSRSRRATHTTCRARGAGHRLLLGSGRHGTASNRSQPRFQAMEVPVMSPVGWERQALNSIQSALGHTDPKLASLLAT